MSIVGASGCNSRLHFSACAESVTFHSDFRRGYSNAKNRAIRFSFRITKLFLRWREAVAFEALHRGGLGFKVGRKDYVGIFWVCDGGRSLSLVAVSR